MIFKYEGDERRPSGRHLVLLSLPGARPMAPRELLFYIDVHTHGVEPIVERLVEGSRLHIWPQRHRRRADDLNLPGGPIQPGKHPMLIVVGQLADILKNQRRD